MNNLRTLLPALLTLACTAMPAWAQLDRPQVAWLIDGQNALRPIIGTAATATVHEPVAKDVSSLACFPEICFAKAATKLYSSTGWATDAPEGPAVFTYASGSAYVYFLETGVTAKWTGEEFLLLPFSPDGELLSIKATSHGFDYAVARDGITWVEHYSEDDGQITVITSLGQTGAILLFDTGSAELALVARPDALHLVRLGAGMDNARDRHSDVIPIAAVDNMIPVGNGYIQINAHNAIWLFRIASLCSAPDCQNVAQAELNLLPPPSTQKSPPELNKLSDASAESASEMETAQ